MKIDSSIEDIIRYYWRVECWMHSLMGLGSRHLDLASSTVDKMTLIISNQVEREAL